MVLTGTLETGKNWNFGNWDSFLEETKRLTVINLIKNIFKNVKTFVNEELGIKLEINEDGSYNMTSIRASSESRLFNLQAIEWVEKTLEEVFSGQGYQI
jgi:hypothetical protein